MARRGEGGALNFVIGAVIGLLVLGVAAAIIYYVVGGIPQAFACEGDAYECRNILTLSDGNCPTDERRAFWKLSCDWGSEVCCQKKGDGSAETDKQDSESAPVFTFSANIPREDKTLFDGQTIKIFPEDPKVIEFDFKVENCVGCTGEMIFRVDTQTGFNVLEQVTNPHFLGTEEKKFSDVRDDEWSSSDLVDGIIKKDAAFDNGVWEDENTKGTVKFKFDRASIGEIYTMRLKVTAIPEENKKETDENDEDTTKPKTKDVPRSETFTLFFSVEPAVRYGPLTQYWSKEKRLQASCVDPVNCEKVYYEIIEVKYEESATEGEPKISKPSLPECIPPSTEDFDNAKKLSDVAEYCMFDLQESAVPKECGLTFGECQSRIIDGAAGEYNLALQEFLEAIGREDLLQEAYQYGVSFSQERGKLDKFTCIPSLSPLKGEKSLSRSIEDRTLFEIEEWLPETNRGSFELAMPFMSEQHLCVYGKTPHGKVYVADRPALIKIDTIPPVATIDFNPLTLKLKFNCIDTQSGCRDYFGVGYISEVKKFLPALFNGQPQNAIYWCPSYDSGAGYEYSVSEIPYHDNAIRVLCLRVEDEVGNAAVSMQTVYNTYQLLAVALNAIADDDYENTHSDGSYYYGYR